MIEIDGKIISKEIFEKKFVCDLSSCKGACCVEGDSGAPLLKSEIKELKKIHKKVKSYMSEKGLEVVEKKGVYVVDQEGDLTTPLINDRECAYVVFENGISKCAIEKAYIDKKINFKKPISCHLYPIRVKNYESFQGINIHDWHVCKPACECGQKLKVPVFKFLKSAIIRKWGLEFYNQLNQAFDQFFLKK